MIYILLHQAYPKKAGLTQNQGPCQSIKLSLTARLNYISWVPKLKTLISIQHSLAKKDLHLEHHPTFSYAQNEIIKKVLKAN